MECKHGTHEPCDLCAEEDAEHDREMAIQARIDAAVTAERKRLLALAKKRADHEASAAAHHAGSWHSAHEHHMKRHAAMRDLIDALMLGQQDE